MGALAPDAFPFYQTEKRRGRKMTAVAAVGRFCCSRWGPRWLPWLCRCVARCTDAGVRGSTTGLRMKGWCVTQVPPWSCYPLCIMNAPDMLCLFNENTNQPGFLLHWPPSLAPNSICVKPSALIVAPAAWIKATRAPIGREFDTPFCGT